MSNYKTVAGEGVAETEEKKSKFIAHTAPAKTEGEAQAFISAIRKKHYNATHNVFAYSIGVRGETVKASDDGEPSGTAGTPILDILRREGITDCVIVVTRYFGGTLLGTGGLVRAYGRAAKEGLLSARVIERVMCTSFELTVDYSLSGKVKYELEKENFRLADIVYAENVTFITIIEDFRKADFVKNVSAWCNGRENLAELETAYFDVEA